MHETTALGFSSTNLVINNVILVIYADDFVLMFGGEIKCLSLLRLKGLKPREVYLRQH